MPSDQVAQFRPDLTRAFLSHWTSRLTPHLRNVLAFLERVYEFGTELFEYKYIRFVDIYSMMIHEVGHIMKGMPESSLQEEIYHCEDKYRRYSSIFSHHKDDIITPMPSFEQLWRSFAILSNILLLRTAVGLIPALAKWCMAGSFVVGYQADAFEYTQHYDTRYTHLIQTIVEKQPVYVDLPSSFPGDAGQDTLFG
ncbi:hypothetical protein BU23DRAFT_155627 [Bimuria novae-zelandiae CBS 107.79]|uniref:Uncharacterized protein n=1 Tax=Bimuria novae-zelandiae CBS 107.79 TaxID=1447943 RepID=A0A6A5V719_9PLEO|nr:hypothetical protein BU23DRAFT_155627 [Bimuria novae-zelandiae CBS 107.79]